MAVNYRNVARLVRAALTYGRTRINTDPAVNLPPRVQEVTYAFDLLYQTRNSGPRGRPSHLDMAAAENYLCARQMVATGTYPRQQVRLMTMGYFSLKVAIMSLPNAVAGPAGWALSWENNPYERYMRHYPHIPTTHPDRGVVIWGLAGADHGEQDREHSHLPPADYQLPEEAYVYSHSYR
jgi:hypothetical protein